MTTGKHTTLGDGEARLGHTSEKCMKSEVFLRAKNAIELNEIENTVNARNTILNMLSAMNVSPLVRVVAQMRCNWRTCSWNNSKRFEQHLRSDAPATVRKLSTPT